MFQHETQPRSILVCVKVIIDWDQSNTVVRSTLKSNNVLEVTSAENKHGAARYYTVLCLPSMSSLLC